MIYYEADEVENLKKFLSNENHTEWELNLVNSEYTCNLGLRFQTRPCCLKVNWRQKCLVNNGGHVKEGIPFL